MPTYPGAPGSNVPAPSNASPIALQKGEYAYVFGVLISTATQLPVDDHNVVGEKPGGLPAASIAVNLQSQAGDPPPMVCVELLFTSGANLTAAAPGVFEVDIQEADTDADAAYITPSASIYTVTAVTANQRARVDLSPTGGKFMRLSIKTLTNNVNLTAKITRLA